VKLDKPVFDSSYHILWQHIAHYYSWQLYKGILLAISDFDILPIAQMLYFIIINFRIIIVPSVDEIFIINAKDIHYAITHAVANASHIKEVRNHILSININHIPPNAIALQFWLVPPLTD